MILVRQTQKLARIPKYNITLYIGRMWELWGTIYVTNRFYIRDSHVQNLEVTMSFPRMLCFLSDLFSISSYFKSYLTEYTSGRYDFPPVI